MPLLPRHRIYLLAEHVTRDEAERFARLFRATWRRLPLGVRRSILRLWRVWVAAFDAAGSLSDTGERIKFAPVRLMGAYWRNERPPAATAGLGGREVCFHAGQTRSAGLFAVGTIAHELAHVYQWASDSPLLASMPGSRSAVEADAERLKRAWGFDFGTPGHVSGTHAAQGFAAVREAKAAARAARETDGSLSGR